jgi:hypothetical protein
MAAPEIPNIGAMRLELAKLLHQEREMSQTRQTLHTQIDQFPSPLVRAQARKLSRERRALHLRIDLLRIDLNLLTQQ